MRIAPDLLGGIAGVIHQNFLRGDGYIHGMAKAGHVELPIVAKKLKQVERGQIASRVVKKHVFRAGIRRVDAVGGLAGMPAIDGRVVLHARVAALPGRFGHFAHQVARAEFLDRLAIVHIARPPVAIFFHRAHVIVGDAHGMVRILEKHGRVRFAVDRRVIALLDQHLGLALFLHLGLDKFFDVRMIHVEDHHLRGAPRFPAALDHARERIEALHETHRAGSDTAARKRFMAAAQRGEIRAGARSPLEQHALRLRQVHDRIHVVLDGVDEAGGALRLGLHAHVEPYRRIESHLLLDQQVSQFVAKRNL